MVKIEVSCDRCRVIISAERTKLAIESGPLRTLGVDGNGETGVDPCRECAEALPARLRQVDQCGNRRIPVRKCPGGRAGFADLLCYTLILLCLLSINT